MAEPFHLTWQNEGVKSQTVRIRAGKDFVKILDEASVRRLQ
jgi:hypothetical protein